MCRLHQDGKWSYVPFRIWSLAFVSLFFGGIRFCLIPLPLLLLYVTSFPKYTGHCRFPSYWASWPFPGWLPEVFKDHGWCSINYKFPAIFSVILLTKTLNHYLYLAICFLTYFFFKPFYFVQLYDLPSYFFSTERALAIYLCLFFNPSFGLS